MMAKVTKKKGGLYAYLDSINVWDKGGGAIALAKEQYYKKYKAEHRKKQRRENKEFTVRLSLNEAMYVANAAKKHRQSITAFIKASSMAYLKQQFVIPDIVAVNTIRELLLMNYTGLRALLDENIVSHQEARTILNHYEEMEEKIFQNLYYPESLEKRIADTLRQNPEYKEALFRLLNHRI